MDICLSKSYKELKKILKDENVKYRSLLTTKDQMCDVLFKMNYFDVDQLTKSFKKVAIKPNINYDDLPTFMKINILEQMEPKELFNFCKVNKSMKDICNDDNFWQHIFKITYRDRIYDKPSNMSWRQYYIDFFQYPYEVVTYISHGRFSGDRARNFTTRGHKNHAKRIERYNIFGRLGENFWQLTTDKYIKMKLVGSSKSGNYYVAVTTECENITSMVNVAFAEFMDAHECIQDEKLNESYVVILLGMKSLLGK